MRSRESDSWPNFAAICYNGENVLRFETQYKNEAHRAGVDPASAAIALPQPTKTRVRRKIAKTICRSEWFAVRKALGLKSSVTSGAVREAFDQYWNDAQKSPATIQRYES